MVILVEDTERGAIFKVEEDEASADAEMLEATEETADKSTDGRDSQQTDFVKANEQRGSEPFPGRESRSILPFPSVSKSP